MGTVRALWAEEGLRKADRERETTESHYREWIFEAAIGFGVAVPHGMFEQTGKRSEPATDGGRLGLVDLAHNALPGDHRAVVRFAQLVVGCDIHGAHEVLYVELAGAAGTFAFLLGEPDFFFWDVSEAGQWRGSAPCDAEAGSTAGGEPSLECFVMLRP